MRKLVGTAALAVLCTALTGCTTAPKPPAAQSSPAVSPSPSSLPSGSSAPAEPVTLRFEVYGDHADVASYRRLAAEYHAQHPNVTIRLHASPDWVAAQARLDRELATGRLPDVFLAAHDAVPALVQEGRVQPVDELLEQRGVEFGDSYERGGLEAFSADSALQCMPHDVSPLVVYYNKDLLHLNRLGEGPDRPTPETGWTWEQFTAAAQQMSHGAVKGLYIEPTLDNLTALVRSAGSDVVDDLRTPTTLTLSDGDTRSALERILTVVRDPRLTPTRGALIRHDAETLFERGRIGMMVGTRALTPRLREAAGLRFDVMPMPRLARTRTLSVMTGYCLAAGSEHVPAAADFLTFAVSTEGASITAQSGGVVPANLAAQHSPAFLQPGLQPKNVAVFIDGVHHSDTTPFVPAWPGVVRATKSDVERMFYDPVIDLDTLLPLMDEQSQRILSPPTASPEPQ